jgi:MinD-like ATPase involved in chromosome partitioning or flagellar assembly
MSKGFVVAVWSPKGGVGKTVIASALALLLAEKQKTVLLEGNADNPDLTTLLQCPSLPNIGTFPAEPTADLIEASLVRRTSRFFVLPGPTRLIDEKVLSYPAMETALKALRSAGMAVVADLSCSLRDSTLIALDLADRVLVPVTLDLLALTPVKRAARELEFLNLAPQKFRVLINRQTDTREITPDDIKAFSPFPVAGMVPSARQVAAAINRGEFEAALGPSSPIGRALAKSLGDLVPTATAS